jgi:hypothetical protein
VVAPAEAPVTVEELSVSPTLGKLVAVAFVGRIVRVASEFEDGICTVQPSPCYISSWGDEIGILEDLDTNLTWKGQ